MQWGTVRQIPVYVQAHELLVRHVRIQKVLSEGSNSNNFSLVDKGREDLNNTKCGSSSALQQNAI